MNRERIFKLRAKAEQYNVNPFDSYPKKICLSFRMNEKSDLLV